MRNRSLRQPWSGPAHRARTTFGRRGGVAFAGLALAPALVLGPAQAGSHTGAADGAARHTASASPPPPPPVRLSTGLVSLAVHPYSSCWTSGNSGLCYDGRPPDPLPSLGGTEDSVRLAFARDHWRFQTTVTNRSGHTTRVHLVRTGPRGWRLAVGELRDGHYTAELFGSGPQGDVAAAFAFTLTPRW
jgi:hypothetical protein